MDENRGRDLDDQAEQLAPQLVGLSTDAAQQLIDEQDGLTIRFAEPEQPLTMEHRFGRITAIAADGVVHSASVG